MGRAQQMLMEFWAEQMKKGQQVRSDLESRTRSALGSPSRRRPNGADERGRPGMGERARNVGQDDGRRWPRRRLRRAQRKDRRFAAPEWRENPIFDTIRTDYLQISDQLLGTVDQIERLDASTREKLRFATRSFVDAMSPSNFALTNPQVLNRTMETRGENLLKGLANMLKDIAAGQLTQTKPGVFEVGRNLATTPGKVVKQTPLYQLIQYTPVDR